MIKKLTFLILFVFSIGNAQHHVKGVMEPPGSGDWIVLYQLKGANQLYIGNATLENGSFQIEIPENSETGMYRLLYDIENNRFIDFIYNKNNLEIEFDPSDPSGSVKFNDSEENNRYIKYLHTSELLLQKLDSIQVRFLTLNNDKDKELAVLEFEKLKNDYLELQHNSEEQSEGMFAQHLIKSSRSYISDSLYTNAQLFFNSRKDHFFDFINFNEESLLNASVLSEAVINYVFYLNRSDDVEVQNLLYKQAVDRIDAEIGTNALVKKELLTVLLHTFAQLDEAGQIDYIIENHYEKLPENLKSTSEIGRILEKVKLSIGRTAPDFKWVDNEEQHTLHGLEKSNLYVLVFWSTDCSHCLVEIPLLYEFTQNKDDIHVISYALERDVLGFNHHTKDILGWTHILGLEKWDNATARLYEIRETPTYFVLDANKKIIAKPEFFRDFKTFYESK